MFFWYSNTNGTGLGWGRAGPKYRCRTVAVEGRACTMRRFRHLKDNEAMSGIQFVTDEKGRKVAVQIDLKKHGAVLQDFWDGLISESRRKEKGILFEKIKADLVNAAGCVKRPRNCPALASSTAATHNESRGGSCYAGPPVS